MKTFRFKRLSNNNSPRPLGEGQGVRADKSAKQRSCFWTTAKGFTIVELLVVIAIISILIGLLLPAVQAARESGRRLQCINNLKQISTAVMSHENTTKKFPTGGWGSKWVGDPDRGNAQNQPGGWAYNVLPFMEQGNLHNTGLGMTGSAKYDAAAKMIALPLPEFICPTRREPAAYPYRPGITPQTFNATQTKSAARTDYAVNQGDFYVDCGEGPRSYDDTLYNWPDTSHITGISFVRSMIRVVDISDGVSNTYLIGEKYINALEYDSGKDPGDNASICQGDCSDISRVTGYIDFKDNKPVAVTVPPLKDMRIWTDQFCFGSAHPATWQVSFCDGSVHSIKYDIDPELHCRLSNRCDGEAVDKSDL
jgi:prepilin-type N-terminal cleavage/methylation domain-containing protein